MPGKGPNNENEAESRRILDRVNVESDVHGGALFQRSKERAARHFSAADRKDEDWIERTGTRIGRYLSVVLLVVVVLWLMKVIWGLGSAS